MKLKPRKSMVNLKNFMAWVKTLSANRRFVYVDNHKCPFAQFLKSLGYAKVEVGGINYDVGNHVHDIPENIRRLLHRSTRCGIITKKTLLEAIEQI